MGSVQCSGCVACTDDQCLQPVIHVSKLLTNADISNAASYNCSVVCENVFVKNACIHVCLYIHVYTICIYVCVCVGGCVCVCVCVYIHIAHLNCSQTRISPMPLRTTAVWYVCVCIYIHISCVGIYTCVCVF